MQNCDIYVVNEITMPFSGTHAWIRSDDLDILLFIILGSSRPPSPASFSLEGRKPAEVSHEKKKKIHSWYFNLFWNFAKLSYLSHGQILQEVNSLG